jgi:hypothetical protein
MRLNKRWLAPAVVGGVTITNARHRRGDLGLGRGQ